ncbi:MAG: DoxX family membrane protein [Acidobacteriota bacterium]
MKSFKSVTRILMGLLFAGAGLNHFIDPSFYLKIMPPYLPFHAALVMISGVAEVVLGIGLLFSRTARYAAWGLIALLIAVFPANVHMAANPELYPDLPIAALYIRLPLQGLLILWAFWYTRSSADSV